MRSRDIPWSATYAVEPPAPPLRDLLAVGEVRQAALRYHVHDRVFGLGKFALNRAFRAMSPEAASNFAANVVAPRSARFYRGKPFTRRMDRMIGRLRPELADDPSGRQAVLDAWFRNTARTMSEFAHLEAVASEPITTVEGLDIVRRLQAEGRSMVVTTVHTGMWEMISALTSQHFADKGTGAWAPQSNRFENRLVARTRKRLGIKVLPATPRLARQLYKVLAEPGESIALVIDEFSEKNAKFPLFGRPIMERCNFTFALRAAQRAGAAIVPAVITRVAPTRFTFAYRDPIEVAPGEAGFIAAAHALNAVYEPHVLAHLDQWYMLLEVKVPGSEDATPSPRRRRRNAP